MLPEPFGKGSAAAALPLHLEVQGRAAQAQLRLALGERLRGVALLARSGERWRIERGALRLGAGAPELPGAPVVAFEGRVSRLDLPAYLALWQQVAAAQTLPPVQARLSTPELLAGRAYGEAQVTRHRHPRRGAGERGGRAAARGAALACACRCRAPGARAAGEPGRQRCRMRRSRRSCRRCSGRPWN